METQANVFMSALKRKTYIYIRTIQNKMNNHLTYFMYKGGSGTKGTVTELKNYKTDTGARNAVHVKWTNGKTCEYRVGASGKMDLIYVEPGVGTDYYRDHLYIPGK